MGFIKPSSSGSGEGGGSLTPQQESRLNNAYSHAQSSHAPLSAEENVQADWNETDENSDAYIKNKPTNLVTESYVDNKMPCCEEIVDIITVPLANILSASDYSVNIDTLNLKSGELYVAEFCGITIVSSSYTDTYDVNEGEEGYNCIEFWNENFTAYISDKSRYEDGIWVDDDNYAILSFETQIEPTTDFVLKKIILTKPLSSYYLGTHFKAYNSISLGRDNNSTIGEMSSAFGFNVVADGYCSYAEGIRTNSNGVSSHAEGDCTIASGRNSHVEGSESEASGENSHAEGRYTKAEGQKSHAEGSGSKAIGEDSHAEGAYTTALGTESHTEGMNTATLGYYSHAEGLSNNEATEIITDLSISTSDDDIISAWNSNGFSLAKGTASHAEGRNNLALGENSHAEGISTIASGISSHAEGDGTTASEEASHAEGRETTASGYYSHAEGNGTTASGSDSHAEGVGTIASGSDSHAEGMLTTASGENSHAEGILTISNGASQHVQGRLNIEDAGKYAHIVGNGYINDNEEEIRSNSHTLDWDGNAWYQGDVYVGGTNQSDGNKLLSTADIYFDTDGNLCVTINGTTKKFTPMS